MSEGKRSRRLPTRSVTTSNEVKLRNLQSNRVTNQHRRFGVPESTVRGMKRSYNEAKAAAPTNDAIKSLPPKKRGPKTLLPEELDQKVMEMASSMRLAGAVVNYNVLIAIAFYLNTVGQLDLDISGVSRFSNDRTLLPEYGWTIRLG